MQFTIQTKDKRCDIHVGEVENLLGSLLPDKRCIYITDDNVFRIYHDFFRDRETIVIQNGEASKNLNTVHEVYRHLIEIAADRKCFIVGMGGGVVTDLSGFVASTFMRGVDFGFISTTLLGQIDAVIGGKNGVNVDYYKNMAGTFSQPEFVINDPVFLQTLPEAEFINGSAELIKHYMVADAIGFEWFKQNFVLFTGKDPGFLKKLIFHHNRLKANIVEADERENGIRKILNFGHTLGHAIERVTHEPHGFAISRGMVLEARISQILGITSDQTVAEVKEILQECRLPIHLEGPIEPIVESLRTDKKKAGQNIDFICLESVGKAGIRQISFEELEKLIEQII